jgi:hypothetical protein
MFKMHYYSFGNFNRENCVNWIAVGSSFVLFVNMTLISSSKLLQIAGAFRIKDMFIILVPQGVSQRVEQQCTWPRYLPDSRNTTPEQQLHWHFSLQLQVWCELRQFQEAAKLYRTG